MCRWIVPGRDSRDQQSRRETLCTLEQARFFIFGTAYVSQSTLYTTVNRVNVIASSYRHARPGPWMYGPARAQRVVVLRRLETPIHPSPIILGVGASGWGARTCGAGRSFVRAWSSPALHRGTRAAARTTTHLHLGSPIASDPASVAATTRQKRHQAGSVPLVPLLPARPPRSLAESRGKQGRCRCVWWGIVLGGMERPPPCQLRPPNPQDLPRAGPSLLADRRARRRATCGSR